MLQALLIVLLIGAILFTAASNNFSGCLAHAVHRVSNPREMLVYHPPAEVYDRQLVSQFVEDGAHKIPVLVCRSHGGKRDVRTVILHTHGFHESIAEASFFCQHLADVTGFDVWTWDPPGFGLNTLVKGNEGDVLRQLCLIYDHLVKRGVGVIVSGYSLGTGPALELAAAKGVPRVALVNAFSTFDKMMPNNRVASAVAQWFRPAWNNVSAISRLPKFHRTLLVSSRGDALFTDHDSDLLRASQEKSNTKQVKVDGSHKSFSWNEVAQAYASYFPAVTDGPFSA